ncbi:hypothetical protein GSI_05627 [Ganoderma sinense ZZ0214-1]|uniref:DUF6534 domain-containing protein n=1 Tax=Ganoderma sinense ZZ0214-1 TaxID=1077348 RepID=A0A2G8SF60_9APHY|nr:hypothetical protein GSI_05627 [Ganoderma sinense ZZ0214-1]
MPPSSFPPASSVPPLDNTFGAVLISTFLALTLYGLVVHQCYRYFKLYPKDGRWIKCLVLFTLLFETFHIVLSTHTCYYYLVTTANNPGARLLSTWSLELLSVTTAVVGVPPQIFFARRIYRLGSRRYRVLVILSFALFAGEIGFLCAGTIDAFIYKPFSEFKPHTVRILDHPSCSYPGANTASFMQPQWLVSAGAGIGVLADGFITAVLVNLLRSKHIGALIYPNNLIYVGFGIVTTKLYANSLLAALNTRNALRYGPNCAITITAAEANALSPPRQEASGLSDSETQVEVQDPALPTSQKNEVSENNQAFLTLELVGIAV